VLAIAGTAVCFGVRLWRERVVLRQEQHAFDQAGLVLGAGKPAETLALIQAFAKPESKLAWKGLEMDALVALGHLPRLCLIYERTPERVLANEDASLLVARAYLHSRHVEEFTRFRDAWRGREKNRESWLAVDSDALLIAGKPREAEKLLRSQTSPGAADATRLVRLALIVARQNTGESWALLNQAAALAPRDPDIRSFRAQILEAVGRNLAARVEYVAALVAKPQNPLLRDQLAEFYRRQGNYDFALQTWAENLGPSSLDFMWVKAGFWSKVIQPRKLDATNIPAGDLQPLAQWMVALGPEQFWNEEAFRQMPQARRYTTERQELFWLRLLDHLNNRREKDAMELLKFGQFRGRTWEPDLEVALLRILNYRLNKSLNMLDVVFESARPTGESHQFFVALEEAARLERVEHKLALSAEMMALLRGPDAFVAALLAAGWREAALCLHAADDAPSNHPDWLAYGIGQAMRGNRGTGEALAFLARQRSSPPVGLLTAEILIGDGKRQEGMDRLRPLAAQDSGVGFRASYILALAGVELHKYDEARQWVARQPLLARSVSGKELLARIALLEKNADEAGRLYRGIAAESVEAKAFLARNAFAKKQWGEARRYTMELVGMMPDELQLRQNLLTIDKAEAGQ